MVKAVAHSYKNFSALLLLRLYDHCELVGRNCRGIKKPAIDAEKLLMVHALCWKVYPTDMAQDKAWRTCQCAIYEMLRRVNRKSSCYSEALLKPIYF